MSPLATDATLKNLHLVPRDYYRVLICTENDYLQNKAGKRVNVFLAGIANVDIKTGEKPVMDSLVKPFNKVKEALSER